MNDTNDNVDYFEIFGLSKQDSRTDNYDKLNKMTTAIAERQGDKARGLELLHNDAMSTFSNDEKYQAYLKKLNAWKSPTDSKAQAELEKERQRAASEAEKRWQAEAAAEEAKRQAIDAEKRAIEAQQQADSPPKTGWQLFGEIAGSVAKHMIDRTLEQRSTQNSSTNSNSYSDELAHPTANLSGVWQDSQGIISTIEQRGNQIAVRGSFGFQVVGEGIGTVNGRTVQLRSQSFQGITDSYLELSPDGRQLNGWGINHTTGQRYYVQLRRR